jgi:RNA polymerase sigma factor (sigma-70 family)
MSLDDPNEPNPDPATGCLQREVISRVMWQDAWDELDAEERRLVRERVLEQRPRAEVAQEMGRSKEWTRQVEARALRKLAVVLDDE